MIKIPRFGLLKLLSLCIVIILLAPDCATADLIIVNKGTNQLAFFKEKYLLEVFPVATGLAEEYTPVGNWNVIIKFINPSWRHPDGEPFIPGGVPENPLGPRWLGLNALNTDGRRYGIHGNNDPSSIGTYISLGCVRMYNNDIIWLYERTPLGTPVKIIKSAENLYNWKKIHHVTINGKKPDFLPHLTSAQAGEKAFLPLRPVAKSLGYQVSWDGPSKTVLVANINREVIIALDSSRVTVNNRVYIAEEAPFLLENSTFVPDYYFERYFEAEASFQEATRTLYLKAPVDPSSGRFVKHHLNVTVNGNEVMLPEDLTPLREGEELLVPVRAVCTAAGGKVAWDKKARTVEIIMKGKQLSIPADGSAPLLNGSPIGALSGIFILSGHSYIKLQFLAEVFDLHVNLDFKARTLNIST